MPQPTGYPGSGIRLSKGVMVLSGSGDPNTSTTQDVIDAGVGSLFLRTDGAANTTLYVRESATTWTAK